MDAAVGMGEANMNFVLSQIIYHQSADSWVSDVRVEGKFVR